MEFIVILTVISLRVTLVCSSGRVDVLDKKILSIRDVMEAEIALLRHDMGNFSSQLAHLLHGTDRFSSNVLNVSQCGCEKAEKGPTGDQLIFNHVIRKGFGSVKKLLKNEVDMIHRNVNYTINDVDRMNRSMTSFKVDLGETNSHVKRINDITVNQSRAIKEQMDTFMTKLDTLNEVFNRRLKGVEHDISALHGFETRINKLEADFNRRLEGVKRDTSALSDFEARINKLEADFNRRLEGVKRDTSALPDFKARINKLEADAQARINKLEDDFTKRSNFKALSAYGLVGIHGKAIYVRPNDDMDYNSASDVCSDIGGYLVQINSEEENAFIRTTFVSSVIYLGGSDRSIEGNWKWAHSGDRIPMRSQIGFQKWAAHEPNNHASNEHCLLMRSNGEWDDHECQKEFYYVCERDLIQTS